MRERKSHPDVRIVRYRMMMIHHLAIVAAHGMTPVQRLAIKLYDDACKHIEQLRMN